ncbi:hypothetical protein ACFSTC_48100 [Nonomuraea ferruginea]
MGCVRLYDSIDRSPFLPLRDDLATLTELATTWAVPVLVVLIALVRRLLGDGGTARRMDADADRARPAALGRLPGGRHLLRLAAHVHPGLVRGCLRRLGGLYELCLLAAALLVLLASGSPAPPISGRRALTAVLDVLVVYGVMTLAPLVTGDESLRVGLLRQLRFDDIRDHPARLLVLVLPVGYLLWRHGRAGKG